MISHTATFVGMPPFPVAAKKALADSQLRGNIRNATHTIRTKRARVCGELDDFEQLRVAAADIKDNVLCNLGRYLEQVEASLTSAGATVHWARDGAEANQIVVDIARRHWAGEVVKVKSMATQEIELNAALEAAGIAAWETDLAELGRSCWSG
jgi:L-lactate dehydrogenase complex protein LldF